MLGDVPDVSKHVSRHTHSTSVQYWSRHWTKSSTTCFWAARGQNLRYRPWTRELRRCSPINLHDSLDSAKNTWRFPFSIPGDTRRNLFRRWYKPKNGRRLGWESWRGFEYMLRDQRLPTPTTLENNSAWRVQQSWLYLHVREEGGREEERKGRENLDSWLYRTEQTKQWTVASHAPSPSPSARMSR
jgi:hypothetical protein